MLNLLKEEKEKLDYIIEIILKVRKVCFITRNFRRVFDPKPITSKEILQWTGMEISCTLINGKDILKRLVTIDLKMNNEIFVALPSNSSLKTMTSKLQNKQFHVKHERGNI